MITRKLERYLYLFHFVQVIACTVELKYVMSMRLLIITIDLLLLMMCALQYKLEGWRYQQLVHLPMAWFQCIISIYVFIFSLTSDKMIELNGYQGWMHVQ